MAGGLAELLGLRPDFAQMLAQRAPAGPQGFGLDGPAAQPGGLLAQLGGQGLNLPSAAQPQPEAASPGGVWSQLGLPSTGLGSLPTSTPTGPEFDRRFNASPPGEGYGLPASGAAAMRAGLMRPPGVPEASSADLPVRGAIPAAGGAPAPSFAVPPAPARAATPEFDAAGSRLPPPTGAAPAAQQPAAPAADPSAAAPESGGMMDRFLSRLGDPRVANMFLGLGAGLTTTRGFAPGLAVGASYASKLNREQATTDLAQAEYGLKVRKASDEAAGRNATVDLLRAGGHSAESARGMVMAAAAGNREALNNALNNLVPKVAEPSFGWQRRQDGSATYTPGGPDDPAYKRKVASETAAGAGEGKPGEPFNLSAGQTRYDADGKPIVSAAPQRPDGFDAEMKLRNEFSKNLGTFGDVHDGYGRVIAATRQREANPKSVSPASDIGLVFGYMKMLDPGSVVREGEYATAANAAGVPERVRNAYNRVMSGEFLTPEQRQDFVGQAGELYGTARKTAEGVAGRYRGLASSYGVDPGRSVYLPEMPVAPRVGGPRGGQGAERQIGPIPEGAVQMLRRDQSLRDQFDAKFGAGAADSVLGRR